MPPVAEPRDNAGRTFNLTRWFAFLSLITISAISAAIAFLVSHYLTREILQRDGILTAQFIHSLVDTEGRHGGLGPDLSVGELLDNRFDASRSGIDPAELAETRAEILDHINNLPDVLLANIFAKDRRIVWSSNPALIGRRMGHNPELDEALNARVVVTKHHMGSEHAREEQAFLGEPEEFYIENYIPLFNRKGEVTTVVEVYKEPKSLIRSVRNGYMLVWGAALAGAAVSYLALFWLVRRAHSIIHHQQKRLLESETLVVIGEMSSAVAHSIRNPLAAIRSSAELGLDAEDDSYRKNLRDIIAQVDRLGRWVRDLLVFSRPLTAEPEPVALESVLKESLGSFDPQFEKAGVRVDASALAAGAPPVTGNRAMVAQVFNSVIANALEAMPGGGDLRIGVQHSAELKEVTVLIGDTGAGMSPQQIRQVFKPFYTTKRNGLGLGLALVKRIMERFGGAVRISSQEKQGTEVRLVFRTAS